MPAKPWTARGASSQELDYVALISYLPLQSDSRVLPFFIHTLEIVKQLASAPGLLGYSLLARPLSKRFWTLSAWESDAAL